MLFSVFQKQTWAKIGIVFTFLFFVGISVDASINEQINYQGKLLDSSSSPVVDGNYSMTFSLYTVPVGGASLWTETDSVSVTSGLFSVMLGSTTSLSGVNFNQVLYLGVNIAGDGEMTPRKIFGTVPAAFEANNTNTFDNIATSSFLRSDQSDEILASTASTLLTLTQNGAGNIFSIFSGPIEVFSVLNDGNIGIGTTSPAHTLTVAGDVGITGALYDATNSAGADGYILQTTSTTTQWVATSTLGFGTGDGTVTSVGLSAPTGFTVSGSPVTTSGTLTFSYASGYEGLRTASSSNWNSFYDVPSNRITAGTNLSWSGNTLNASGLGDGTFLGLSDTFGSFTTNRIPFTNLSATALTDSASFTFDGVDTLTLGGMTLSDAVTTHSVRSTTTIPANDPFAWTISTGIGTSPLFRIDTTTGAEYVNIGNGTGDVLIGDVGSGANLVFEESSTISGQGTNTITLGVAGDVINAAVNFGIGSTSPQKALSVVGDLSLSGGFYDSGYTAGINGYVLQTTGSGTQWVATSTLNIASPFGSSINASELASEDFGDFTVLAGVATLDTDVVSDNELDYTAVTLADFTNDIGYLSDITGESFLDLPDTPLSFTPNRLLFTNSAGTAVSDSAGLTFSGTELAIDGSVNITANNIGYKLNGSQILYASSSNSSTLVGIGAGQSLLTSGIQNTALGYQTLASATSSNYNTAIGYRSLYSDTSGSANVGIGHNTLFANKTGSFNVAVGYGALLDNTTGGSNLAIGNQALSNNISGSSNVGIGELSLYKNINGSNNVAIGDGAAINLEQTSSNIAIGSQSLYRSTTTDRSILIGYKAGEGVFNQSTYDNTIAIGYQAGRALTSGNNNLLLGYQAGDSLSSGSNNIIIGYDVEAPSNTISNQLNIGNLIFGTGIDGVGTTLSSGNIGIGTTSPTSKLDVWGDFRVGTSSTSTFLVDTSTGYVGIGTTTPDAELVLATTLAGSDDSRSIYQMYDNEGQVRTELYATGRQLWYLGGSGGDRGKIEFGNPGGNPGIIIHTGLNFSNNRFNIASEYNGKYFSLAYQATGIGSALNILPSGNIAVGTTTANSVLTVQGDILTTGGLVLSGFTSNITLGSNYISGDGDAEGISIDSAGIVKTSNDVWIEGDISFLNSYTIQAMSLAGSGGVLYGRTVTMKAGDATNLSGSGYGGNLYLGGGIGSTADGDIILHATSTGNVGIGTTSPFYKLDVAGDINIVNGSTLKIAGSDYSLDNLADAHYNETEFNLLLGGSSFTGTFYNNYNTALGRLALSVKNTDNTQSFYGDHNVAIGDSSIRSNTIGYQNTALGSYSLRFNTTGHGNAAGGYASLFNNSTGVNNSAMGSISLYSNTTGGYNVAQGAVALRYLTDGFYNTAVGYSSGRLLVDGVSFASSTDYSVFIGNDTRPLGANDQNTIVIGSGAYGLGSNTVVLGNDSIVTTALKGNVGIGTTSPTDLLHIYGDGIGKLTIEDTTIFPVLKLFNSVSNPSADTEMGRINFKGYDSTGVTTGYAQIKGFLATSTNVSEGGYLTFTTMQSGTLTETMRIDENGNVGIGTTSPSAQLHTTGSVRFETFGAGTLQTDANGNLSVSSDERLKNIVGFYEPGLNEILQIHPIQYRWREETGFDTEGLYTGFSAQNVQLILPDAVGEDKYGFLTLSDRPILAAVVTSIQQIWERVTGNTQEIQTLEERIQILEAELNITPVTPPSGGTSGSGTTGTGGSGTSTPPTTGTSTPPANTSTPPSGSGTGSTTPPASTSTPPTTGTSTPPTTGTSTPPASTSTPPSGSGTGSTTPPASTSTPPTTGTSTPPASTSTPPSGGTSGSGTTGTGGSGTSTPPTTGTSTNP